MTMVSNWRRRFVKLEHTRLKLGGFVNKQNCRSWTIFHSFFSFSTCDCGFWSSGVWLYFLENMVGAAVTLNVPELDDIALDQCFPPLYFHTAAQHSKIFECPLILNILNIYVNINISRKSKFFFDTILKNWLFSHFLSIWDHFWLSNIILSYRRTTRQSFWMSPNSEYTIST